METNANHPATPGYHNDGTPLNENSFDVNFKGMYGLTKREYFAAMAMQGLCAGCENHFQPEYYAEYSVKYADALIEELNK